MLGKLLSFPFGDSGNFAGANCCQFSGVFQVEEIEELKVALIQGQWAILPMHEQMPTLQARFSAGTEAKNGIPPWLLWSCCDVDIFADILPIFFGYGLEMSEKKTRVFRNMREEKCLFALSRTFGTENSGV